MPVELLMHIVSYPALSAHCKVYQVNEDMSRVIDSFILYTHTDGSAHELALTDGKPFLAFMIDAPHLYCFSSGKKVRRHVGGYLSGTLFENTYINRPDDMRRLLIVRFTDEGLYHILKKPLYLFRNQSSWSLHEIFGLPFLRLNDQLKQHNLVDEKIKLIEDFVRKKVNPFFQSNETFRRAVQNIRITKGQIQIEELTQSLQVNYKWLERNFQKYLGISPKEFARNYRFLSSYAELRRSKPKDMLQIALDNGYYDQNHFTKDFKKFTGKTPGGREVV